MLGTGMHLTEEAHLCLSDRSVAVARVCLLRDPMVVVLVRLVQGPADLIQIACCVDERVGVRLVR